MSDASAKPFCYSARLVHPFIELLAERGAIAPDFVARFRALDPDMRVPIAIAERYLLTAIEITHEAHLGLLAGRSMTTGDCPALDYATSTAASVREAVHTAIKYARVANDALRLDLEERSGEAFVHLSSAMPLARASAEFMMASFFSCHVQAWQRSPSELRCHFAHPAPENRLEYERTFGGAHLVFDVQAYGFAFPSEALSESMKTADPRLHHMAKKYADLALRDLPQVQVTLSDEIRRLLPAELSQGRTDSASMARKLHMSRRTLVRRLEAEDTSYKALLDEVRHKLALHHLGRGDVSTPEIACLLGFSDVTTFHRGFKRWTQKTPGSYRSELGLAAATRDAAAMLKPPSI